MHDVVDLARWSATAEIFGAQFGLVIEKLQQEIESRVAEIADDAPVPETILFQAHAISSFAGNYGCVRLHVASRELQHGSRIDGVDLGARISEVRRAADATLAFLRSARAGTA